MNDISQKKLDQKVNELLAIIKRFKKDQLKKIECATQKLDPVDGLRVNIKKSDQ